MSSNPPEGGTGIGTPPKRFNIRGGAAPAGRPTLQPAQQTSVGRVVTVATEEATDPVSRLRRGFDDIQAEIRKVVWPTRQETINLTILVIGLSASIGILLGLFDLVLTQAVSALIGS